MRPAISNVEFSQFFEVARVLVCLDDVASLVVNANHSVMPVFLDQAQAIDYAMGRACFRSGEIRVLNSSGKLERTIAFSEADRKL